MKPAIGFPEEFQCSKTKTHTQARPADNGSDTTAPEKRPYEIERTITPPMFSVAVQENASTLEANFLPNITGSEPTRTTIIVGFSRPEKELEFGKTNWLETSNPI